MIIGIDIRPLASGRHSGIEEYIEQLLAHLLPLDPSVTYRLLYSSWRAPLKAYPWLELPNVTLKALHVPNRALLWSARLAGAPKLDQLIGGCDVFFSPHLFLAPLSPWVKRVTTYHDLSFERFPEFFSWRQRAWHRITMRPQWQARFSHRIIAVSESTKADLADLYGIDPAKIRCIHSGVSRECTRPDNEAVELFRIERNLPKRFILFFGAHEPRKNIHGILEAFALLAQDQRFDDVELVLAGAPGWLCRDLPSHIAHMPCARRVHAVTMVSNAERAFLYAAASVFIYPSFLEGFGFPPLEAMACGTPVIVSNSTSLAEVVGTAGLLIHPYSVSDSVTALRNVLSDDKLAADLARKGRDRAAAFSWEQCAKETLDTLIR